MINTSKIKIKNDYRYLNCRYNVIMLFFVQYDIELVHFMEIYGGKVLPSERHKNICISYIKLTD